MSYRLISLIENPPAGFQYRPTLSQKDVRRWPFALLAAGHGEAETALTPFGPALTGIIVTFGPEYVWHHSGSLLFHLTVPYELSPHLAPLLHSHLMLLNNTQRAEHRTIDQTLKLLRAGEDSCRYRLESELVKKSLVEELAERRLAETALEKSEQRFRSFVENINDVLFVLTSTGLFSYVSPQWKKAFGYELDETIGQSFMPFVHPDDIQNCIEFLQLVTSRGQKQSGVEYRVRCKDGSYLWYTANASQMNDPVSGTPSLVGIGRDITARKEAERALLESEFRWKFAIEGSGDGVWDWNIQTDEASYSRRWKEMLGYADQDILPTNQEWLVRIHPDDRSYVAGTMQAYLQGKTELYVVEYRLRCKDDTYKWILGRGMIVQRSDDGAPLRMIGTHTDISERKMHEKEQLKMEKLESLGILAGGIAHDFNNILTGIMGNISFAQMFLDAAHKSFKPLAEAEKASARATELAHQLLTFARGGEPVKKVISPQYIVNETVSLVLHGSNVKGAVAIPDTIHAIEADEGQLSQVFHNIIINATQAMPGGGILSITACNKTLDGNNPLLLTPGPYIQLSFTDQGCGISNDNLLKIFDPYFTTKATGNGLGLASAHSIILRHGGHIGVHSEQGCGTTFTVHLPAIGETYAHYQDNTVNQYGGERSDGRILVMDDEEMIRVMTSEILSYLGYQVTACENGFEAIARYKAARETGTAYAAVIMDLTVPGGMGGKEAAEQILAIDPQACLIVSSGYSDDPVMSDYTSYGFAGAVTKPYNLSELEHMVRSALTKRIVTVAC